MLNITNEGRGSKFDEEDEKKKPLKKGRMIGEKIKEETYENINQEEKDRKKKEKKKT